MTIHNPEIADLFNRYATLLEIQGANPFRVRAYRNAARTIRNLPRDIAAMLQDGADLTDIPNIGADLAHKLSDIVATGKFGDLEAIKRELPPALADLMEVPGVGPKRLKVLFDTLNIQTLDDLVAAAQRGALRQLPGFGAKIEANILKVAEQRAQHPHRFKLSDASRIAEPLMDYLRQTPGAGEVIVAGSYRRKRETVGDLDILATCRASARMMDRFVDYAEIKDVISKGTTRASVRLESGIQVDLRVVSEESYGPALVYFTGSKAHNIHLRTMGIKRGLKINEYGVYRRTRRIAGRTESDVYAKLGLPYIEPELREDGGEIEAAMAGKLPRLLTLGDIKGDLHCHTAASDGQASLDVMVKAARARGYAYLAITDHSKYVGITHGLDAKQLAAQMRAIDKLNARLSGFRVLKGIELDILPDGKLALSDAILRNLDVVVASIHSAFNLPAKAQTERIIRAMDNPNVTIIGHPFGRLIGEREPCALDAECLMTAARVRGCALEVNAQPSRLDLSDHYCRMAKEAGVKLAISTDAHTPETLGYMRYGIDQARRGWIEPDDVANTRPLEDLLRLLRRAG